MMSTGGAELKTKLEDMLKFFEINQRSARSELELAKTEGIIRALKESLGADMKNTERAHAYLSGLAEGYQKTAAIVKECVEKKKQKSGQMGAQNARG